MINRMFGSLLRGSAAPVQLLLACILGALIGFVPGARDHMGLVALYAFLLLVLNASVGLALFVSGVAKLASLALMSVSFSVGRMLIDGPLHGFVAWSVEAPVFALLDLDVYAVTGGALLGLGVGALGGIVVVSIIGGFRKKAASLEQGSEKYQALMSKFWVKLLVWLVLGKGHGKKKSYDDLATQGFGKPIRVVGLALVAVIVAALWLGPSLLGNLLTATARDQLEQANGATVDLDAMSLALLDGRIELTGLSVSDPKALDTDLLRTVTLESDASVADLLRGRVAVDKLVVNGGRQGADRSEAGRLVVAADGGDDGSAGGSSGSDGAAGGDQASSIDALLEQGGELKERLAQAREWLDKLSPGDAAEDAGSLPAGTAEMTLEERLMAEVEAFGYGNVAAPGLRQGAPRFLLRELIVDGLQTLLLGDELVDARGTFLSSDPELVAEPARFTANSRDGTLALDIGLGGARHPADANRVLVSLTGLSGDSVGAMLGGGRLSGGQVDIVLDGHWAGNQVGMLDLPLNVTLRDTVVDVVGGPRQIETLALTFHLKGPIDGPSVTWDRKQLQDALLAQGRAQLDAEIDAKKAELDAKQAELEALAEAEKKKLKDKQNELVEKNTEKAANQAAKKLGGLFGKDDDDDG